MVAIEGGFRTQSGELFNELPDRFSDAFVFIGAGYYSSAFAHGIELGWLAAVLSIITAYVRTLGAAMGAGQHFLGPMAKQHRMAIMTGVCLAEPVGVMLGFPVTIVMTALGVVCVGCLVTIIRRCRRIASALETP
jgi:phosphatidylglycerophosphate synthase